VTERLPKLFETQFSTALEIELQRRMQKLKDRVDKGFYDSPRSYIGAVPMRRWATIRRWFHDLLAKIWHRE